MSFWRRGKRRRTPPPQPTSADSPPIVSGFVSSEYTGRTILGKQVVRIGDPERWRQQDALRDQAQSALDPDDESQVQTLTDLLGRYADLEDSDPHAAQAIEEKIQAIGQQLCQDGGSDRMKLIAFRIAALNEGNPYANVRSMESFWDGICGWQV